MPPPLLRRSCSRRTKCSSPLGGPASPIWRPPFLRADPSQAGRIRSSPGSRLPSPRRRSLSSGRLSTSHGQRPPDRRDRSPPRGRSIRPTGGAHRTGGEHGRPKERNRLLGESTTRPGKLVPAPGGGITAPGTGVASHIKFPVCPREHPASRGKLRRFPWLIQLKFNELKRILRESQRGLSRRRNDRTAS